MKTLPYRVETGTGDIFDIEFPLHENTGDPVRVSQLVSQLLTTLDRDLALFTDAVWRRPTSHIHGHSQSAPGWFTPMEIRRATLPRSF